ncbi:hypothetical protein [Fibrobacter sp. UWEL]|uniref:hypothetical protein n=1 Tax=Fibrobacter sp. UWEL TaxID=1896209 RepID=UPI00091505AB|nr:hypothetical protein [Fibrobacter sp. UWEL]SHL39826.1 hypothetical protein SAMN05720468_12615 [Fibrobacter sp. UWEL]
MSFSNKKFTNEDKIKMFERMGATGAIVALIFVFLLETGYAGQYVDLVNMGLTAMIVVLAVSLAGSVFFKTRRDK